MHKIMNIMHKYSYCQIRGKIKHTEHKITLKILLEESLVGHLEWHMVTTL